MNITVPHKAPASDLMDALSDEARQARAVNVLVFGEDGRSTGHNTDSRGFSRAIREEFQLPLSELKVLILGAGGAGRAIAFQAARERAERIVIANRTIENARALARDIEAIYLDDKLEGQAARLRATSLDETALAAEVDGDRPIITLGAMMPTTSTWRIVPTIISSGSGSPSMRVASSALVASSSAGSGLALWSATMPRAMS